MHISLLLLVQRCPPALVSAPAVLAWLLPAWGCFRTIQIRSRGIISVCAVGMRAFALFLFCTQTIRVAPLLCILQ